MNLRCGNARRRDTGSRIPAHTDSIQMQLANRYGVRIPDAQFDEAMTRLPAKMA